MKVLSDYQDRSFASAYGVLIKELKLTKEVEKKNKNGKKK